MASGVQENGTRPGSQPDLFTGSDQQDVESVTSSTRPAVSLDSPQIQPPNENTPIVPSIQDRRDYKTTTPQDGVAGDSASSDARGIRRRNPQNEALGGTRQVGTREQAESDVRAEQSTMPWYRRLADKYGSVELENRGSTARDHLALERTFLAWLRTSLAFASIGIAITQLFRLNTTIAERSPPSVLDSADNIAASRLRHVGKPLGATFIAISIVVLFIGFHRYFESQHWIIRGKFPASRGSIAVITFIAGALIVSSLVVIISVAPKAISNGA